VVEADIPGRKGKTKMPKRLVHFRALEELGYPFEEEEDFIFVRRALGKEQIDEIIKLSEKYKTKTTSFQYEKETDIIEVPPPPESVTSHHTSRTSRTNRSRAHSHAPPPPPPPVVYQQPRSVYDERIEESQHVHGPLTVFAPDAQQNHQLVRRRSESEIREDFRNLEIERRTVRDGDREYELVPVKEPGRDVVRVEKDRKGRLALIRSAH